MNWRLVICFTHSKGNVKEEPINARYSNGVIQWQSRASAASQSSQYGQIIKFIKNLLLEFIKHAPLPGVGLLFQCRIGFSMVATTKLIVSQPTPNNSSNDLHLTICKDTNVLYNFCRLYLSLWGINFYCDRRAPVRHICPKHSLLRYHFNKMTVVAKIWVFQQLNSQLGHTKYFQRKKSQQSTRRWKNKSKSREYDHENEWGRIQVVVN